MDDWTGPDDALSSINWRKRGRKGEEKGGGGGGFVRFFSIVADFLRFRSDEDLLTLERRFTREDDEFFSRGLMRRFLIRRYDIDCEREKEKTFVSFREIYYFDRVEKSSIIFKRFCVSFKIFLRFSD